MTERSLFASLRGKDGRSLARALVVLVLISLFAGGLNAGAAAADQRPVICAVAVTPDAKAPGPDGHLLSDCCFAGVMPLGMGLAATSPEAAPPAILALVAMRSVPGRGLAGSAPARASARDPPLHG